MRYSNTVFIDIANRDPSLNALYSAYTEIIEDKTILQEDRNLLIGQIRSIVDDRYSVKVLKRVYNPLYEDLMKNEKYQRFFR